MIKVGNIVSFAFHFSSGANCDKPRPCVVLSVSGDNVVVAPIKSVCDPTHGIKLNPIDGMNSCRYSGKSISDSWVKLVDLLSVSQLHSGFWAVDRKIQIIGSISRETHSRIGTFLNAKRPRINSI